MPFLFCQAAAIVSSHLLHALNISNISTFAVFVWFALSTVGAVLFYHFVKVSLHRFRTGMGMGTGNGNASHCGYLTHMRRLWTLWNMPQVHFRHSNPFNAKQSRVDGLNHNAFRTRGNGRDQLRDRATCQHRRQDEQQQQLS